jgi:hypothetical protein
MVTTVELTEGDRPLYNACIGAIINGIAHFSLFLLLCYFLLHTAPDSLDGAVTACLVFALCFYAVSDDLSLVIVNVSWKNTVSLLGIKSNGYVCALLL